MYAWSDVMVQQQDEVEAEVEQAVLPICSIGVAGHILYSKDVR